MRKLIFVLLIAIQAQAQVFDFTCSTFFDNVAGKKYQGTGYDGEDMTHPFSIGYEFTETEIIESNEEFTCEHFTEAANINEFLSSLTSYTLSENRWDYTRTDSETGESTNIYWEIDGDNIIAGSETESITLVLVEEYDFECEKEWWELPSEELRQQIINDGYLDVRGLRFIPKYDNHGGLFNQCDQYDRNTLQLWYPNFEARENGEIHMSLGVRYDCDDDTLYRMSGSASIYNLIDGVHTSQGFGISKTYALSAYDDNGEEADITSVVEKASTDIMEKYNDYVYLYGDGDGDGILNFEDDCLNTRPYTHINEGGCEHFPREPVVLPNITMLDIINVGVSSWEELVPGDSVLVSDTLYYLLQVSRYNYTIEPDTHRVQFYFSTDPAGSSQRASNHYMQLHFLESTGVFTHASAYSYDEDENIQWGPFTTCGACYSVEEFGSAEAVWNLILNQLF